FSSLMCSPAPRIVIMPWSVSRCTSCSSKLSTLSTPSTAMDSRCFKVNWCRLRAAAGPSPPDRSCAASIPRFTSLATSSSPGKARLASFSKRFLCRADRSSCTPCPRRRGGRAAPARRQHPRAGRDALPSLPALQLLLPDAEVLRVGMVNHDRAHRRLGLHHELVREHDADLFGAEQVEERALHGQIGAGRIPEGVPPPAIARLEALFHRHLRIVREAPPASDL